jgi:endonuclease III-like uncharacterized protein
MFYGMVFINYTYSFVSFVGMVTSKNKYAEITTLFLSGLDGDQAAYGKFLATITPMLRRMVGKKVAHSEVEDVVQEINIHSQGASYV